MSPNPALAEVGITEIIDHYDRLIRALPEPPIVIGHSFGGTVTLHLLDRGLGVAGVVMAESGMKVALIERKFIGGTCVNTGCMPTKTLVASARAAHMSRRAADFGIRIAGEVALAWWHGDSYLRCFKKRFSIAVTDPRADPRSLHVGSSCRSICDVFHI